MDQETALAIAKSRYGDCNATISANGDLVISVSVDGNYLPLGFGQSWEDALIDCACQSTFFQECAYA